MHVDLTGTTALVTGASRGIGRAIAGRLARSGATVALHTHRRLDDTLALAGDLGRGARAFQADLADPEACHRLFHAATAAYGRVHLLVNNAGVSHPAPLATTDDAWLGAWDETLAVNLRAAALLSRYALLHFVEHGGGRLIHVASRAGIRGDTAEYLAYAASKGGLVALHRSIARAYGKHGVTSFLLAPGFVRTDMAQAFIDAYGEAHVVGDLALDRLTEPEDLAPLVALLASGAADHATGCTIDVNAGSYVH